MIYSYGFSIKGKAHENHDIVCQDSNYLKIINDRICVAAVADGLGSEIHSGIASDIACHTSVEYCSNNIELDMGAEKILSIIKQSFNFALEQIEKRVESDEGDILQYDTTLSLCVLVYGKLYYGHSGDSGIIALSDKGLFYKITEQQRDDEGRVFPLAFGEEYWEFGLFKENVAGVLLATDGMLELFYPVYLRYSDMNIYTSLARYFLNMVSEDHKEFDVKGFQDNRFKYVANIPESVVDDDKTIVAIMDNSINVLWQNEDYYKEPDWVRLKEEYQKEYKQKAYPGEPL